MVNARLNLFLQSHILIPSTHCDMNVSALKFLTIGMQTTIGHEKVFWWVFLIVNIAIKMVSGENHTHERDTFHCVLFLSRSLIFFVNNEWLDSLMVRDRSRRIDLKTVSHINLASFDKLLITLKSSHFLILNLLQICEERQISRQWFCQYFHLKWLTRAGKDCWETSWVLILLNPKRTWLLWGWYNIERTSIFSKIFNNSDNKAETS